MSCLRYIFTVALVTLCYGGVGTDALDAAEECKDQRLCDIKPPNYNDLQNEIDEKFRQIQEKLNLKNDESEEVYDDTETFEPVLNCPYKTRIIKPYTVKKNGTTLAVVQTSFYEQKFRTTECVLRYSSEDEDSAKDGEECFQDLTTGTSTGRCTTKYTSIALYTYDNGSQKIERVPVELPVCCHCSIRS